jgi:site-specific recombinase XerD
MAGLVELVDAWVRDRRTLSRRGLSPNTERAYRQDLAALAARIADLLGYPDPGPPAADGPRAQPALNAATNRHLCRVLPRDLTADALKAVASVLVEEGKSPATRARMLSAWRGFSRWLVVTGSLPTDPTLAFETPVGSGRLPVAFTEEELLSVLEAASSEADPGVRARWPLRDRALVAVLAGAGLRAAELCGLKVGDVERMVDTKRNALYRLHVTGKGSKDRVVPVAAEVVAAVDEYLRDRASRGLGGSDVEETLFVRTDGRHLNTQALDYLVDGWLRTAKVKSRPGEKAHAFRHTYALGQVDNGTSVAELRELLGHADLSTTGVYLRMAAAELQASAGAAPIARLLREARHSPTVAD